MDPIGNKKRTISTQRLPLKETSGNITSPNKRLKTGNKSPTKNNILQNKPNLNKIEKPKPNRLVGEELQQWRSSWKKIMRSSVVYFDTQGIDLGNLVHKVEQKRAQRALKYVGCAITPFYDKDVTIIVSRRPYSSAVNYNSNDIFNDVPGLKIKVWNYDKVFRFLKNLGITDFDFDLSNNENYNGGNNNDDLYNLLKEEKIFGSTDKDPNAKRDDLYYLSKNYLYVYDLSQVVRPIAVREWYDYSYPVFHLTLDGKCPFIPDSENLERKKAKRFKKFEETETYRKLLRDVSLELVNNQKNRSFITSSASSTDVENDSTISQNSMTRDELDEEDVDPVNDREEEEEEEEVEQEEEQQQEQQQQETASSHGHQNSLRTSHKFSIPKPNLVRDSSCIPTNNSNSRFYDVAASGYNGESNALLVVDSNSNNYFGNGLGPTISQVPSKNLNNLKKRIFMKKQKQKSIEDKEREKDLKPGYCENCRVKYESFADHINSSRHRNFACNDENFKDIDSLINTLNESKSFGYITSDGAFSYAE